MGLYIGYAQSSITPDLSVPVFLAGFGQNRRAETIHDELFIRAIALRSDNSLNTLVLASADLIGFFRQYILEIQRNVQAIQPYVDLVFASTHTHHAPDTLGLWGPNFQTCGADPAYLSRVIDTATQTILASLKNLSPADMLASSITVEGVVKNTRDPDILDQELSCLQFNAGDKVLATLLVFPCHPEVLWEHNPHLTADYPAYLRRKVEDITHAPCIFFNGALGGMMTPAVIEHSFQEADRMGTILANAAIEVLRQPQFQHPFSLPLDLSLHKEVFNTSITNPIYLQAIQAGLLPDITDENKMITSEVNLIKIGDIWLVTVPGELLPKLGLKIKDSLRKAGAGLPIILGLANDELGYILPEEDFHYPENPFQPGNHYEETNSINPEIGSLLMKTISHLIETSQ